MPTFIGRAEQLLEISTFVEEKGSGLVYIRGRRRIGKSWLLKEFQKQRTNCFYFSGISDETNRKSIKRFVSEWGQFSAQKNLFDLRADALNWKRVFLEINNYAFTVNHLPLIIIIDEIQWMAKKGSGFVGSIKEAWLDWEKTGNIKVIICGSSNKFFDTNTGGDEKILRGIKTSASVWVPPFALNDVHKYFLPQWSMEEVCLTYMMLGGVPYYLAQIEPERGFIHAINSAIFCENTVFLEEVDEVLQLEFNRRGCQTVKKILSVLGQKGCSQQNIQIKTGLSLSNISEIIDKLMTYGILNAKSPAHSNPAKNNSGQRYYMKDPFLNFYFQILGPLQHQIKANRKGLLFPYACLRSKNGFYIPNFSGQAFELLVRNLLETRSQRTCNIFSKLQLLDTNYEILDYWDAQTEIDLVVEHNQDRIARIIECKWISDIVNVSSSYLDQILSKSYPLPKGCQQKYYLVLSQDSSKEFLLEAQSKGVGFIQLSDLFSTTPGWNTSTGQLNPKLDLSSRDSIHDFLNQ